jgi:hypothetical protein
MAKLQFDYAAPIEYRSLGNVIDPKVLINIELGIVQGVYYERMKRLDTNEEWLAEDKPVPFVIHLTPEDMQNMLGIVMARAVGTNVLRPATPAFDASTPVIVVTVTPATANVAPNGTVQLAAEVTNLPDGGNAAVTWEMKEADLGTVDSTGLYTAPAQPGTYRVIARSVQDATTCGFCDVTVA